MFSGERCSGRDAKLCTLGSSRLVLFQIAECDQVFSCRDMAALRLKLAEEVEAPHRVRCEFLEQVSNHDVITNSAGLLIKA
jgi:hypothetical protein